MPPASKRNVWFSIAERFIAGLTKAAPEPQCRPVSDDDSDLGAAKAGTRILMSELNRLDWETWLIEGVSGNRFVVVTKLHHCMADCVSSSGVSLMVGTRPDTRPGTHAPGGRGRRRRARFSWRKKRCAARSGRSRCSAPAARQTRGRRRAAASLLDSLQGAARGAWRAAQAGLRPVSETPLKRRVGPHRLEKLPNGGILKVLCDAPASAEDSLPRFAQDKGMPIEVVKLADSWEIYIQKP